jgi:AcrR family transcriptional regulator
MARAGTRSADDWVDAAYERFNAGGLGAVKVEAVARDLGTTKGSFYWHFTDRPALVRAVTERWEARETDRFIVAAEGPGGSPHERLSRLFSDVAERNRVREGEAALYREAEAEGVADIVRRVSERRVAYLAELIGALGIEVGEARRRAVASLAMVLGMQQLAHVRYEAHVDEAALTATALAMATSGVVAS